MTFDKNKMPLAGHFIFMVLSISKLFTLAFEAFAAAVGPDIAGEA